MLRLSFILSAIPNNLSFLSNLHLLISVALNITAKKFEKPKYECRAFNAAMRTPKTKVIELDVLCECFTGFHNVKFTSLIMPSNTVTIDYRFLLKE